MDAIEFIEENPLINRKCPNCSIIYKKHAYPSHYKCCTMYYQHKLKKDNLYHCLLCSSIFTSDKLINKHLKQCIIRNNDSIQLSNPKNNIEYVQIGDENIEDFTDEQYNRLLMARENIILQTMQEINFNSSYPQYQNIRVLNMNANKLLVYNLDVKQFILLPINVQLKYYITIRTNDTEELLTNYERKVLQGNVHDKLIQFNSELRKVLYDTIKYYRQNLENPNLLLKVKQFIFNDGKYLYGSLSRCKSRVYTNENSILQNYYDYLLSMKINLHCINTFNDPNVGLNIWNDLTFIYNVFSYYAPEGFINYIDSLNLDSLFLVLVRQIFYNRWYIQNSTIFCFLDETAAKHIFYIHFNVNGFEEILYNLLVSLLRDNINIYILKYIFNDQQTNDYKQINNKICRAYQLLKEQSIDYSFWITCTNQLIDITQNSNKNPQLFIH